MFSNYNHLLVLSVSKCCQSDFLPLCCNQKRNLLFFQGDAALDKGLYCSEFHFSHFAYLSSCPQLVWCSLKVPVRFICFCYRLFCLYKIFEDGPFSLNEWGFVPLLFCFVFFSFGGTMADLLLGAWSVQTPCMSSGSGEQDYCYFLPPSKLLFWL